VESKVTISEYLTGKRHGFKRLWPNLRHRLDIFLEGLNKSHESLNENLEPLFELETSRIPKCDEMYVCSLCFTNFCKANCMSMLR
jgi:hypothetical protein